LHNALHAIEPVGVAGPDLATTTSVQALAATFVDSAAMISLPIDSAALHTPEWHSSLGDIGGAATLDMSFGALSTGTDVLAVQMDMPTMATAVAMPSAEALMALDRGPVQTVDTVEQILVDALHGGGVNQIDALMNALPDAGNGGIAVIDSAASGFHASVPTWDMGGDAGFTAAIPSVITADAMILHVDAIQPAANG